MTSPTRDELTAIWNRPGVENPGHINIWEMQSRGYQGFEELAARPGAKRVPAWDKAILKYARIHLPNWFANKSKPY